MAEKFESRTLECNRCGRCCYYELDGKLKKCRYLVRIRRPDGISGNGSTLCRIYNQPDRVGKVLDKGKDGVPVRCHRIEELEISFKGCPFNEGKPLFKVYPGD